MDDRDDEMVRRAADLKAQSAALKLVSEELAGRLARRSRPGTRTGEQPEEQGLAAAAGALGGCPASPGLERAPALPAPGTSRESGVPGRDSAGEVPVTLPGAGILDEDEAAALAGLLEELAVWHQPDPLSGPVTQAAALLRRRLAAGRQRSVAPRQGGSADRREAGDVRDDAAGLRDAQAEQRDRLASDRDDRAKERDRQADAADVEARASDQRMRDRLWDADLRGQAAAERAATAALADGGAGWQLGREEARADRARDGEDREAMREMLAQARAARQAAWHDRYAAGQDRVAANRDRGSAQADRRAAGHDRHAASADRDQAVIENEEEDSPFSD